MCFLCVSMRLYASLIREKGFTLQQGLRDYVDIAKAIATNNPTDDTPYALRLLANMATGNQGYAFEARVFAKIARGEAKDMKLMAVEMREGQSLTRNIQNDRWFHSICRLEGVYDCEQFEGEVDDTGEEIPG